MANPVVRTDNLTGTVDGSQLRTAISTETMYNGTFVKLTSLADGEREAFTAETPSASTAMTQVALVAAPEVFYDDTYKGLEEFEIEAGTMFRCYNLHSNNDYSVTAEAFADGSTLEVGSVVELTDGYKAQAVATATAGSTTIGTITAIESESGYTFYVVHVA